jgi:hypothetical protein
LLFSACAGLGGKTTAPVTTAPTTTAKPATLSPDTVIPPSALSLASLAEPPALFMRLTCCVLIYEHETGAETATLTVFLNQRRNGSSADDVRTEVRIYRIAPADFGSLISGESISFTEASTNSGNVYDMMILRNRIVSSGATEWTAESSFSGERAAAYLNESDGKVYFLTEDAENWIYSLAETLRELRGTGVQHLGLPSK